MLHLLMTVGRSPRPEETAFEIFSGIDDPSFLVVSRKRYSDQNKKGNERHNPQDTGDDA